MRGVTKSPATNPDSDEELYLLGVNRLAQFIDFVQHRTVGGNQLDEADIADQWRGAADRYIDLQIQAPPAPPMPQILELAPQTQAHVDALVKVPQFQRVFSSVPIAFGLVELDALIVYQHSITLSTVKAICSGLPKTVTSKALAATCLPLDVTKADFQTQRLTKREFIFHSNSHDMRFLGAQLVDPALIPNLVAEGFTSAVIALSVGFSSNVLNVVRYQNRMVLNNGYHRAYALRSLGVTHVPCVIQVCRHWEDVGLAGSSEMSQNSDLYFSSQRPPLFRDYFDPKLTSRYATMRQRRQIQLKIEVDSKKILA